MDTQDNIKVISINELLAMTIEIPEYQRPYKWAVKNMEDLLSDVSNAINDYEFYKDRFKYRVGTIILHKRDDMYSVVDGQQRIISLLLMKLVLEDKVECTILRKGFSSRITQRNIRDNYIFVKEYFSLRKEAREKFIEAFEKILEVVVVCVEKISEAFQLFDSQNNRGKSLDPHDLLKAYHLREMKNDMYEMKHAVIKWEAQNVLEIRELFDGYLFPVWNWSRCIKSKPFTEKEIDTYKGVEETSTYTYAKRVNKAMPYFQITEPFVAGRDFFEMVDYYIRLIRDIKAEMGENTYSDIREVLENKKHNSTGFLYAKNLFYCALLFYYDKFHNFDELIVKKLFTWAFMIRVDMQLLGKDTINKYAVGDKDGTYSNVVDMFRRISLARRHNEIARIQINVGDAKSNKWNELSQKLRVMNGLMEDVVDEKRGQC